MATLKRLPDWEKRFINWVKVAAETPFEYGKFDCGLMTGDAIEALSGVDVVAGLRNQYKTPVGAYRTFQRVNGFEGFLLDAGAVEVHQNFAQRGDIAEHQFTDAKGRVRTSLAICAGSNWLIPAQQGVEFVPRKTLNINKVWRIQ